MQNRVRDYIIAAFVLLVIVVFGLSWRVRSLEKRALKAEGAAATYHAQVEELKPKLASLTKERDDLNATNAKLTADYQRAKTQLPRVPNIGKPADQGSLSAVLVAHGAAPGLVVSPVLTSSTMALPDARLMERWMLEAALVEPLKERVAADAVLQDKSGKLIVGLRAENDKNRALADTLSASLALRTKEAESERDAKLLYKKEVGTLKVLGTTKLYIGIGVGAGTFYLLDRFVFKR